MSLHVGYRIMLNWAETNVHSIKIGTTIGTRTSGFLRRAASSDPKWTDSVRCNTAGRWDPRLCGHRDPYSNSSSGNYKSCPVGQTTLASLTIKQAGVPWAKELSQTDAKTQFHLHPSQLCLGQALDGPYQGVLAPKTVSSHEENLTLHVLRKTPL